MSIKELVVSSIFTPSGEEQSIVEYAQSQRLMYGKVSDDVKVVIQALVNEERLQLDQDFAAFLNLNDQV
jgi:hypothetical protein